jgi:hypothetical protein
MSVRHTWSVRPVRLLAAALGGVFVAVGAATAAPAQPAMSSFGAWATAGSRVAFDATIGRRSGLWVQAFGSNQPRLLTTRCGEGNAPSQIAAGPSGSWACLTAVVGNNDSFYAVDFVSATGSVRQVARAGGSAGSIRQVVGDGAFLGYLRVTPAGVVQLFRITAAGRARRVADLPGVAAVPTATTQAPSAAAVTANGTLAIRQLNGTVALFTTTGRALATLPARAASIALTSDRLVVRTATRRLVVYGLRGGLVHTWPLGAASFSNGLAAFDGYAAYLGANKAVRLVNLANGADRVVARSGSGWFWNGLSLQAPGIVAPLTAQHGSSFVSTLRFVPTR